MDKTYYCYILFLKEEFGVFFCFHLKFMSIYIPFKFQTSYVRLITVEVGRGGVEEMQIQNQALQLQKVDTVMILVA